MTSVSKIETPLLKVPFEALKRAAKDRKGLVDHVVRIIGSLSVSKIEEFLISGDYNDDKIIDYVQDIINKLKEIQIKLETISQLEETASNKCNIRGKHLLELGEPDEDTIIAWNNDRLDRLLIDHFLRIGCTKTALALTEQSNIKDLVDAEIFMDACKVLDGLKKQDCSEAKEWCKENRSKLKKHQSKLEFRLHIQVFIELVRENKIREALDYAKANFAPWAQQHMAELQRAIATLAFKSDTTCQRYKELFDIKQWDEVIDLFLSDLFQLNSLTQQSLLVIHLQAGLSALNTPNSHEPGCSNEDPLHLKNFQKLAEGLPYAKYDRSKLICCITKETMNETNPPYVLPNGYVYSAKAINKLKNDDGKICCPITNAICEESEIRRVYIV